MEEGEEVHALLWTGAEQRPAEPHSGLHASFESAAFYSTSSSGQRQEKMADKAGQRESPSRADDKGPAAGAAAGSAPIGKIATTVIGKPVAVKVRARPMPTRRACLQPQRCVDDPHPSPGLTPILPPVARAALSPVARSLARAALSPVARSHARAAARRPLSLSRAPPPALVDLHVARLSKSTRASCKRLLWAPT